MSQHDFVITNSDANTGITFRAAINAAFQALASNLSGVGDPATTYPYQFKVDTGSTPKVFYMRKGDNTAWTRLGYIDSNGRLILDRSITSVTGAYTALLSDDIILASGTFTITLPLISSLSGAAFSKEYTIINDGTGVITVDGNGTEKIGEQLAVALKPGETLIIAANGATVWKRLGNNYSLRFEDIFPDCVLSGLLGTDPGASLTMATPQGTAYVSGRRIVKQTGDTDLTYAYPASQDTYDYLRVDGAIVHQEVANGAGEPSQPSSTIKLQKVVTNGTEITGVTDMRPLAGMAASQTAAANKIPITDANGKLDSWIGALPIREQSRGLIVQNNATNPNYQTDIDADEIILQNSSYNPYRATSVNLTVDITVDGVNGCPRSVKTGTAGGSGTTVTGYGTLFTTEFAVGDVIWFNLSNLGRRITAIASDTSMSIDSIPGESVQAISKGGEAPNTWYYIWVIYNGSTVASLLSTSATAPTMPSGYTFKALMGAVFNNSSSNLEKILKVGRTTQYTSINTNQRIAYTAGNVGSPSTPTWVAIPCRGSALPCPPTAKRIYGYIKSSSSSAGCVLILAANDTHGNTANMSNPAPIIAITSVTSNIDDTAVPFNFNIESDNIYWAVSMGGSSEAAVFVLGYED